MIAYNGKHYKFQDMVKIVKRKHKGWSKERASAYVAGIEKRQGK